MKERPILFSTPMVEAIQEGRKTQTRRLLKPQPLVHNEVIKMPIPLEEYVKVINRYAKKGYTQIYTKGALEGMIAPKCPFGEVGDILWVREKWMKNDRPIGTPYFYYAGAEDIYTNKENERWKPSIHMLKEACRIWLKITEIRVEKLHDISEEDAIREGIESIKSEYTGKEYKIYTANNWWHENPLQSFKSLWQKINGAESWNANPWVWVISFEQI